MLASLVRTSWLISTHASAIIRTEEDSDWGDWATVAALCVVWGLLWLLAKYVPAEVTAAKSRRGPRLSKVDVAGRAPANPVETKAVQPSGSKRQPEAIEAAAPRSLRQRVIRLHAITPGQAVHEYNVGDSLGTRGSSLIKVA